MNEKCSVVTVDTVEVTNCKALSHLLGLAGPERLSQQLHGRRGVYKPAVGANHEGEQAAQLLHERYVSLVLSTKSNTSPLLSTKEEIADHRRDDCVGCSSLTE